jgi:hypothetical protein
VTVDDGQLVAVDSQALRDREHDLHRTCPKALDDLQDPH